MYSIEGLLKLNEFIGESYWKKQIQMNDRNVWKITSDSLKSLIIIRELIPVDKKPDKSLKIFFQFNLFLV